jgi:Ca-activated chloride channel family protein
MNDNTPSSDRPEFEEWHLTALALGELDTQLAASTQKRIDADPDLARQYAEIQSTLALVGKELKNPSTMRDLDEPRRDEVIAHIQSATRPSESWGRDNWRVAGTAGLLALAASVVLLLQWKGNLSPDIRSGTRVTYEIPSAPSRSSDVTNPMVAEQFGAVSPADNPRPENSIALADAPSISSSPSAKGATLGEQDFVSNAQAEASERRLGLGGGMAGSGGAAGASKVKLEERAGGAGGMPAPGASNSIRFRSSESVSAPPSSVQPSEPLARDTMRQGRPDKLDENEGRFYFGLEGLGGGGNPASEVETLAWKDQKADESKSLPEELRANIPSYDRRLRETGDRFDAIPETPFVNVDQQPLSTFSIDVDTASYTKLRQYVLEQHTLPSADSIRIEEWINYFEYDYPGPKDDSPFAAHLRLAACPWNPEHKLVRVAIAAKKPSTEERPSSNLVFLIDVSGSMSDSNKLPLVKRTLQLLTSQLREQDRVAIVVYAGAAGCVLPSTSGANKETILASINELQSGGSTNGGQGIQLAYNIAKEHFIAGGINRVLLCTDGDFNVGVTGTDQLVAMMRENAQSNIFLTCLGYGIGNYNDSMMEQVSNQGNGIYAMVDSELEAKRVMVEQLSGTLMTVAKDVKLQIEFNPAKVASYRLIGYENRRLATKDFADDRKDAGEIGAGHCVTALYEVVPAGAATIHPADTELRYAKRKTADVASKPEAGDAVSEHTQEWLYLKIRSKQPEASESTLQSFVLSESKEESYRGDQSDMDWASSVAEFGLLMRRSQLASGTDWDRMLSRAMENAGSDPYRRECILIMQQSRRLSGR